MSAAGTDCIFCKIASGEMGTSFVVETENVVAFDDIAPQAPCHVLVIPRKHVQSVQHLEKDQGELWTEMLEVAQIAAKKKGVETSGYRVVSNSGPDANQEVLHLHIHVLGGRRLGPIA